MTETEFDAPDSVQDAQQDDGLTTGATTAGQTEGDTNLSVFRAAWDDSRDEATRRLLEEDAGLFLHQSLSTPCLDAITSSDGIYLTTVDGRKIMDFHGNSVHQLGYGHPRVIAAVEEQLRLLPFSPRRYTNRSAIELARALASLAPGDLHRVLFAPGGAEAVSMALKLARLATGRHKTVSMWGSFHGGTLDTISLGGQSDFRVGMGPLMTGTEHVPPVEPARCPWKCGVICDLSCAEYVEYVLDREGDVAAVVSETVRNTPHFPPREYWQIVRAACDRHGALLILDEIPTGLGRTGTMFAFEHYGIVPDIAVLGKGLGGGVFPLAAVIAREHLNIASDTSLGHFTHEKSPVGASAALATLQVIEDEKLLQHARDLGDYTLHQLRLLETRHQIVSDIRGRGLLLGVELRLPDGRPANEAAEMIMYACLRRNLSFKVSSGNVLTLIPPLITTRAQMEDALQIIESSINEYETT